MAFAAGSRILTPMRRLALALPLALLTLALVLPPSGFARALTASDGARFDEVVAGVWCLKAALALFAIAWLALSRWKPAQGGGEPMLELETRATRASSSLEHATVAALLVLALALRLHDLGNGIWFDEIDTLVHHVRLPFGDVITTYASKNQHLLYSVLAKIACVAAGESTAALRFPAALLGVASLWALWRFALRVTSPREALIATAVLGLSYQHLWFSQNARGYTGLLLFTLLGSSLFLDLVTAREFNGLAKPLAYALCMALSVYVHLTALFVVAGHGVLWLALLARGRGRGPARWAPAIGFAFTALIALVLYALVLPQFSHTTSEPIMAGQETEWNRPSWFWTETLSGVARGLPGGWVTLVLGSAVFALGVVSYLRQGPWILALFFSGIAMTAAAVIAMGAHLWPRFFFFAAGFLVLIAVRGLCVLARSLARGPLAGRAPLLETSFGLVACAAAGIGLPRAFAPKQDYAGALAWLQRERAPSDAVVTVEMTRMPYENLFATDWSEVDNLAQLMALEDTHARTWLVYTMPTLIRAREPELWTRIERDYETLREFPGTVVGGAIVVARKR